jgi:radical SAM superfamily enzyme YgiQ (UPF0313 family)
MPKTKVAFAQFNVDFSSEYLPYSVALLQAYAQQFPEITRDYEFVSPMLYKRDRDIDAVARKLAEADIAAFSVYVWNTQYSLSVAKKIKALNPEAAIVFGGPNVPDKAEGFLRKNPAVDFTLYAEGELAFKEFLLGYKRRDLSTCPSLRYVDKKTGEFRSSARAERIRDLAEIPSPYLGGVFDRLMKDNPNQTWNVLWETNRGCPFSCTYCDWGSAVEGKVNRFPMDRLMRELDWFQKNRIEYLMCADANFGMMERDVEIAQKMADLKRAAGYPTVLAATFTKNATERSYTIAKTLMGVDLIRGYTVSTQSVDETTLVNVRRDNISQETFTTLQARFNRDRLPTYTDLIIGLPGETYESFRSGITEVIARGQHNKVYFIILSILPNSQMADSGYREKHGLEVVWGPQKNLHETIREDDADLTEYQELVVATRTLPRDDWRRAVSYGYMVSLIYFNKLMHIPLTSLLKMTGIPFADVMDAFVAARDEKDYPLMSRLNASFEAQALSIQRGGSEYARSNDWLNVWWQPDKLAFMECCRELDRFYVEAARLLAAVLREKSVAVPEGWLKDAVALNKALVRSPFQPRAAEIVLDYNVYDYYRGILEQNEIALRGGPHKYVVHKHDEKWASVDDWCRKMVWFGNKTSAYLSSCSLDGEGSAERPEEFKQVLLKPYLYA